MAERPLRRFRPLIALFVAFGLLAIALPGLAGNYPQTTLEPKSEVARLIDGLLDNIGLWCTLIFVLVEGALVGTVLRFRRRPGGPAARPIHGNTTLEITWTIIPAIILALIAVPTVKTIFKTQTLPAITSSATRISPIRRPNGRYCSEPRRSSAKSMSSIMTTKRNSTATAPT